jgi:hypothetical protein
VAGFDWGARTANVMAALWPERCRAMVSVSGYDDATFERSAAAFDNPDIGHNLPQEAPLDFVHAVQEADSLA